MKVFLGCDHAGFRLKEAVKGRMLFIDRSPSLVMGDDYPDVAARVAREVVASKGRGVLICASGIGMSMAANKIPGARAALCRGVGDAVLSRKDNNANILCLGGLVTSKKSAEAIIDAFLKTRFSGGRHRRRVVKMSTLEK